MIHFDKACRRLGGRERKMSDQSHAVQRRARAISLMEQALAELDGTEDVLVAMRLQHALDVAREDGNSSLSIEDRNIPK